MNAESHYWFYSTNAQVFGAMVAVGAVFIVYRLQQLQQIISTNLRTLIAGIKLHDSKADALSLVEQLKLAKRLQEPKAGIPGNAQRALNESRLKIKACQFEQVFIKHQSPGILRLMIYVVSYSLVMLWLPPDSETSRLICGLAIFISIFLDGYTLYSLYIFLRKIAIPLRDDVSDE